MQPGRRGSRCVGAEPSGGGPEWLVIGTESVAVDELMVRFKRNKAATARAERVKQATVLAKQKKRLDAAVKVVRRTKKEDCWTVPELLAVLQFMMDGGATGIKTSTARLQKFLDLKFENPGRYVSLLASAAPVKMAISVQCNACSRWVQQPPSCDEESLPEKWYCASCLLVPSGLSVSVSSIHNEAAATAPKKRRRRPQRRKGARVRRKRVIKDASGLSGGAVPRSSSSAELEQSNKAVTSSISPGTEIFDGAVRDRSSSGVGLRGRSAGPGGEHDQHGGGAAAGQQHRQENSSVAQQNSSGVGSARQRGGHGRQALGQQASGL